ncbi:MAG: hypothetical protein Ct9H300mP31_14480 [Acidimicrobiaceae bacterium]|nr:MAG: hypothetical protein Ct9H300mP31_14480 [Acidimicrobiaceae bacterium]
MVVDRDNNDIYIGGFTGATEADFDPDPDDEVYVGGPTPGVGTTHISRSSIRWGTFSGRRTSVPAATTGSTAWQPLEGRCTPAGTRPAPAPTELAGKGWEPAITTSSTSYDPFVLKMNSSAKTLVGESRGGTGTSHVPTGKAVAIDGSGNVYTTGHYRGTADLDSGSGTAISPRPRRTRTKCSSSSTTRLATTSGRKGFPSYGAGEAYGVTTDSRATCTFGVLR